MTDPNDFLHVSIIRDQVLTHNPMLRVSFRDCLNIQCSILYNLCVRGEKIKADGDVWSLQTTRQGQKAFDSKKDDGLMNHTLICHRNVG